MAALNRREFVLGLAGARRALPNILVLMPDQWRGMDLGCMGNRDVRTPHLDRLASEGVAFSNAVANCPVCTPARSILLTGRFAHSTGTPVNDVPLPDAEVTIAELLKPHGYRTGFIGKWHLEGGKRQPGFVPPGPRRQGFDYWAATICDHDYFRSHYFRDDPTPIPIERYDALEYADRAIEFLSLDRRRPFCLYVAWGPPHNPYVAPPEFMRMYDPAQLTMRPNWRDGVQLGSRRDLAGYYAAMTCIDGEAGRILEALERNGQRQNTIVLVTSDHGDMLGSHGTYLKRKPWEESIRVPGLLRYPARLRPRGTSDLLFSHADVVPTLLGFCGLPKPGNLHGRDLSRDTLGARPGPESIYLQIYTKTEGGEFPPWRGVRTRRYTYARFADRPWVLYDNRDDPYQRRNLAGLPEHRETQAWLDGLVRRWFSRTGDDWKELEDRPFR
ncbi:MAG: sulfatase [Acidobacteria bacterium]|nr:sulfatase [Acidobacteriota bacterium]